MRLTAIIANVIALLLVSNQIGISLLEVMPSFLLPVIFVFVFILSLIVLLDLEGGGSWLSSYFQRKALEEKRKIADIQKELEEGR